MLPRRGSVFGFFGFVCGYATLIVWFKWVDVYHAHFATTGLLVIAYNLFRALFVFYLFWIIYGPGALVLRVITKPAWTGLGSLERLPLGFFAGAGVWHILLLALGYLKLYTAIVAIALTVPALALSFRDLCAANQVVREWVASRPNIGMADLLPIGLVILFGTTLLMVKGLYPAGGIDYFTHYFYYYQTVIDRGDVWPNEIWYHYYYSKGAGLFFLGILLTDPLAPQLVTACFVSVAGFVVYLLAYRVAPETSWPWIGTALFFAAYIYTPIWGQFEKQHEINAALVLAIGWLTTESLASDKMNKRRMWITAAALATAATVILSISTAAFLIAVFGLLAPWLYVKRDIHGSLLCISLALVSAMTFGAHLAINYFTTGLIDDRDLRMAWRFADLERLNQWGALPMVIKLYWGRAGYINESLRLAASIRPLIYALRLDLIYPLVVSGILVAIAARFLHKRGCIKQHIRYQVMVFSCMVLITIAVGLTMGRVEQVSFFRYSSFSVPIVIAVSIALWSLPAAGSPTAFRRAVRDWRTPQAIFVMTIIAILAAASGLARFFDTVLPRAWSFASGFYSIDMAYTLQVGWPDKPWGAIYPGARGAYAVAGPHTPIWSLHVTSFCMLPDCRIEGVDSFTLGPAWSAVMFGSPEDGRSALQAWGRNYFLFSRELPIDDYLPLSALFTPDNIAQHLGIRWTDGTTTLLTWLEPGVTPLDAQWLAAYRQAVEGSAAVRSFPYKDMQAIFARLGATARPWRSFELPWRLD